MVSEGRGLMKAGVLVKVQGLVKAVGKRRKIDL